MNGHTDEDLQRELDETRTQLNAIQAVIIGGLRQSIQDMNRYLAAVEPAEVAR